MMLLLNYTILRINNKAEQLLEEEVGMGNLETLPQKEKLNLFRKNTRKNGVRYKGLSRRNNNRPRSKKGRKKIQKINRLALPVRELLECRVSLYSLALSFSHAQD